MAELMPDGRRRSREHWTDSMEAGPPDPPAHVHRMPTVFRIAVVGLVGAVFLLLVAVGLIANAVVKQQQYIEGKGTQRDEENARLHEQIRQAQCDLLDQLPEGGLLQGPRDKYGCGPGIPLSQLPPSIQQRYAPTPTVPQSLTPLPLPSGASPGVQRDTPGTLPPRTGPGPGGPTPTQPSPDPTPPPSPLQPVTQPVCDLTGLCF